MRVRHDGVGDAEIDQAAWSKPGNSAAKSRGIVDQQSATRSPERHSGTTGVAGSEKFHIATVEQDRASDGPEKKQGAVISRGQCTRAGDGAFEIDVTVVGRLDSGIVDHIALEIDDAVGRLDRSVIVGLAEDIQLRRGPLI